MAALLKKYTHLKTVRTLDSYQETNNIEEMNMQIFNKSPRFNIQHKFLELIIIIIVYMVTPIPTKHIITLQQ